MILHSCDQKQQIKKKILIEKDSSGNVISKIEYYISPTLDTVLEGKVVHLYPNGKVEDSFRLNNGLEEGYIYLYDSIERLVSKRSFRNGKMDGLSFSYYPNGIVEAESLHKKGEIIYSRNFFPNGILKNYFIMKNNSESCYYLIKDSTGNIIKDLGDSSSCRKTRETTIK